jgi:tRNA modification GTPase
MDLDTICAPATPPVNSAIAIIRISGPDTLRAVNAAFRSKTGIEPRYAAYGSIVSEGGPLDDVIVIYYRSPQSYTGEDMAEIFCHGNPIIIQKILKLLRGLGARLAEPGEFTKRAFLNGKVDLTEAEAINHIIMAKSEWEIETALKQMHGSLKLVIDRIRSRVIELKADVEAGIDFSDEDIDFLSYEDIISNASGIRAMLEDLLGRCRTGERLSRGIDITITGKPNVGKSSVLNLLLNQERAIVSRFPGTTRDVIREPFQIGGMHVNLNDTAGIDRPGDEIESMGMDLSWKKIESSQFIIMVLDATSGMREADAKILDEIGNKKKIILVNKIDIAGPDEIELLNKKVKEATILFSAKTGAGLGELKAALSDSIRHEFFEIESSFIADLRIVNILEQALGYLLRVRGLAAGREPHEIIAFELQSLLDSLAAITGEITAQDVLDSLFNRFCIGK